MAFNTPWKTDAEGTLAKWCLFQHWCSFASEFIHFILVITFWIVFPKHLSLWLRLACITLAYAVRISLHAYDLLLPWYVGLYSRKPVILMDWYLKQFSDWEKQKNFLIIQVFCCLRTSSYFQSVEQLTRGAVGICCDQNDWTDVAWQLKGICFLS